MAIIFQRGRGRGNVDASVTAHNIAIFAAHLATFCHFCHPPCRFLPFLPPVTRNVTLSNRPNRLEFSNRDGSGGKTHAKSGKNGNVDHPSQHYPLVRRNVPPALPAGRGGWGVRTPHHPLSLIASQQPDMLIMLLSIAGSTGTTIYTGAHLAAARGGSSSRR